MPKSIRVRRWFSTSGEEATELREKWIPGIEANEEEPGWDPERNPSAIVEIARERVQLDVLGPLKSGKEATVYVCRASGTTGVRLVAAKLFRDLTTRGFRNDAVYRAGRNFGRERLNRAYNKGLLDPGLRLSLWVGAEFEALHRLHRVGADVPRPLLVSSRWMLMDFVGNDQGPAPMLARVKLTAEEAAATFERIMRNMRLFLSCDIIHGDLSAFNVLWWQGAPRIIDFPQAVDPRTNPNSFDLLTRDARIIGTYFSRYGVGSDSVLRVMSDWEDYLRGRLAKPTPRES
ncbi:MAG: RIO1 family regulatory kinase/ATPase [Candidatus Coatesbacteria bacterium]